MSGAKKTGVIQGINNGNFNYDGDITVKSGAVVNGNIRVTGTLRIEYGAMVIGNHTAAGDIINAGIVTGNLKAGGKITNTGVITGQQTEGSRGNTAGKTRAGGKQQVKSSDDPFDIVFGDGGIAEDVLGNDWKGYLFDAALSAIFGTSASKPGQSSEHSQPTPPRKPDQGKAGAPASTDPLRNGERTVNDIQRELNEIIAPKPAQKTGQGTGAGSDDVQTVNKAAAKNEGTTVPNFSVPSAPNLSAAYEISGFHGPVMTNGPVIVGEGSSVQGDIEATSVVIKKGAVVNGRVAVKNCPKGTLAVKTEEGSAITGDVTVKGKGSAHIDGMVIGIVDLESGTVRGTGAVNNVPLVAAGGQEASAPHSAKIAAEKAQTATAPVPAVATDGQIKKVGDHRELQARTGTTIRYKDQVLNITGPHVIRNGDIVSANAEVTLNGEPLAKSLRISLEKINPGFVSVLNDFIDAKTRGQGIS